MEVCRVRNVLVKMELKQLYLSGSDKKSYGRFDRVATANDKDSDDDSCPGYSSDTDRVNVNRLTAFDV